MTRIIAGVAGGRRLVVPSGRGTRPTADRAREGLFSTIEAVSGPLAGCRFLDLYAGSGAVGLEALSRGAGRATLVESDPKAARAAATNVRALGLPGAQVVAEPVERVLAAGPPDGICYDVVFADPPYADPVDDMLAALLDGGWLCRGALVAVERASRDRPLVWPEGLAGLRERRYGEGTLWYGRAP